MAVAKTSNGGIPAIDNRVSCQVGCQQEGNDVLPPVTAEQQPVQWGCPPLRPLRLPPGRKRYHLSAGRRGCSAPPAQANFWHDNSHAGIKCSTLRALTFQQEEGDVQRLQLGLQLLQAPHHEAKLAGARSKELSHLSRSIMEEMMGETRHVPTPAVESAEGKNASQHGQLQFAPGRRPPPAARPAQYGTVQSQCWLMCTAGRV